MNGAVALFILVVLFAVWVTGCLCLQIRWDIQQIGRKLDRGIAKKFKPRELADTFTCSCCKTGPWHNSWSPDFSPPLCPNCSGAD